MSSVSTSPSEFPEEIPESIDTPESVETVSGCGLVSVLLSESEEEDAFSWLDVEFFFSGLDASPYASRKSSAVLSAIPSRYKSFCHFCILDRITYCVSLYNISFCLLFWIRLKNMV